MPSGTIDEMDVLAFVLMEALEVRLLHDSDKFSVPQPSRECCSVNQVEPLLEQAPTLVEVEEHDEGFELQDLEPFAPIPCRMAHSCWLWHRPAATITTQLLMLVATQAQWCKRSNLLRPWSHSAAVPR